MVNLAVNKRPLSLGPDGITRSPDKENELNKLAAGIFASQGGKEFLRYLRSITTQAVLGPHAATNELFHREGMRFLVGIIEQRIARGQNGTSE